LEQFQEVLIEPGKQRAAELERLGIYGVAETRPEMKHSRLKWCAALKGAK